ncbi:hypothetical protein AB4144_20380, partial [Rhizobiaceae sp. 2RAB30]
MPDKIAYELGARKSMAVTGPDPCEELFQEAAEIGRLRLGVGLSEEIGKNAKKKRTRDQPGPLPERDTPPPRDTREAPVPNPDGAPGTANAPFGSKVPHGGSRQNPQPENDEAAENLKKPVNGAVGDALARRGT